MQNNGKKKFFGDYFRQHFFPDSDLIVNTEIRIVYCPLYTTFQERKAPFYIVVCFQRQLLTNYAVKYRLYLVCWLYCVNVKRGKKFRV